MPFGQDSKHRYFTIAVFRRIAIMQIVGLSLQLAAGLTVVLDLVGTDRVDLWRHKVALWADGTIGKGNPAAWLVTPWLLLRWVGSQFLGTGSDRKLRLNEEVRHSVAARTVILLAVLAGFLYSGTVLYFLLTRSEFSAEFVVVLAITIPFSFIAIAGLVSLLGAALLGVSAIILIPLDMAVDGLLQCLSWLTKRHGIVKPVYAASLALFVSGTALQIVAV